MKIPFTGGCECGAVRYECSAEPMMMFKCHCRDCQRVTGGAFVAGLLVPMSAGTLITICIDHLESSRRFYRDRLVTL